MVSKQLGLLVSSSSTSNPITLDFFGADCNNAIGSGLVDSGNNPAQLKTIRFWDSGVKWAQLQSSAGVYNFTPLDNWITACQKFGYDIIYVFGATPTFIASKCSGAGNCSDPVGFTNTCCPPSDVNSDGSGTDATFKAFVTALINHVKPGTIKYYELWNEQDSGNFWSGNMSQAVRMGQDAATIIRSLDPNATIISPSFHGPTASTFFVNYCTTKVNGLFGWQNFDVVNCHMRASDTNQAGNKNANVDPTCFYTPYNQTLSALTTLKNQGIDLTKYPLWDDEHGYIPGQGGDGYPPAITDAYVFASYVAISSILRASVPLSKQVYYCWTSANQFEKLQNNFSGTAWNGVANILINHSVNGSVPNTAYSHGSNVYGPSVYTVTVDNGKGLFVWDMAQTYNVVNGKETPTYSSFVYPNGYTRWVDMFGDGGNLSGGMVNIGIMPIYLS